MSMTAKFVNFRRVAFRIGKAKIADRDDMIRRSSLPISRNFFLYCSIFAEKMQYKSRILPIPIVFYSVTMIIQREK